MRVIFGCRAIVELLNRRRLRGDAPLAKLLRRAMDLAEARGSQMVGRADLLEALTETEAVGVGLDLERLRFVRFWLGRAYQDGPPARRRVGEDADAIRSDS